MDKVSPSNEDIRTMLLWGAVGGMLPTLSKIAGTFGANFDAPPPRMLGVCVALLLYGAIGAIVSRAMENPAMKHSLFAGIAAPAIVVSIIAGVTDSTGKTAKLKEGSSLEFIGSAYAQAASSNKPAEKSPEGHPIGVLISVKGEATINDVITVTAIFADGKAFPIKSFRLPTNPDTEDDDLYFDIPTAAKSIKFTSLTGIEARTSVKPNDDYLLLSITPKTSVKQDLVWALGGKRSFEVGKMVARSSMGK